jgi:hypothetical protein
MTEDAGPLSAPMVAALEAAWAAIRVRHADLPAAVVVLASGTTGAAPGTVKLGHFAALRWRHGDTELPEVFVGGEGLARGPVDVLGTCCTRPRTPSPTSAASPTPHAKVATTTAATPPSPANSASTSPNRANSAGRPPPSPSTPEAPTPTSSTSSPPHSPSGAEPNSPAAGVSGPTPTTHCPASAAAADASASPPPRSPPAPSSAARVARNSWPWRHEARTLGT